MELQAIERAPQRQKRIRKKARDHSEETIESSIKSKPNRDEATDIQQVN